MTEFHGFPTALLENKILRLEYLTTAGPRIVRLSYQRSSNLLAEVPDIALDSPRGKYYLLGGHRLWTSPEAPEFTYTPDGSGLKIQVLPGSVELTWDGPEVPQIRADRIGSEPPGGAVGPHNHQHHH